MYYLQLLSNGILLGGVYAMIGLGMAMVFGIVGLTNLSHGEFVILGAYGATLLSTALGVNPILCLLITTPAMFLIGYLLQSLLINGAMEKGEEPALLVTFGVSVILQDAMLLLFTADARHAATAYEAKVLHLFGLSISLLNVVLFVISLLSVLLLTLFLNHTYAGRAIRAVSDDREAAVLSGINVRRIYALAMGVAMATASVAGLCVGMKWTFYPSSGGLYLLVAFIVVVIGGLGNIPGTLLAGLGFGIAQVVGGANYGLVISYAIMLLALVLKPKNALGQ